MPELPEVEKFRQILLPLVSTKERLQISAVKENPPKVWLSTEEIAFLHDACYCTDVIRKGKQLCMVLQLVSTDEKESEQRYLFLHMGMTGRISSPGVKMSWGHEGSLKDNVEEISEYPPKYAYLTIETSTYKVAFEDPRKFGKCELLEDHRVALDELAPDALDCGSREEIDIVQSRLSNQSMGIKGILLDQKRACSGVGNWVADEVLYQTQMHPDQQFLTTDQASTLFDKLQEILVSAVDCLNNDRPYPSDWLFPYRWTKKKAGKDSHGRSITFLKSGGRTSAIIASAQKLYKSQGKPSSSTLSMSGKPQKQNSATGIKRPKSEKKDEVLPAGHGAAAGSHSKRKKVRRTDVEAGGESSRRARRRSPRFSSLE